jgi:TRAP-type C4-dicarboxylate transport system permease small subunit
VREPSSTPRWLAFYARIVGGTNRLFAAIGMGLVALLMLTILEDVVARYALQSGSGSSADFSGYLLTYLFFFGLAPALASGHHVAVDLFERAVPRPIRSWLPVMASALCIVFGAILLWFVTRATLRAFAMASVTPTMVSIPVWWIYAAGPIGVVQFVATAALQVVQAIRGEPLFEKPKTAPGEETETAPGTAA